MKKPSMPQVAHFAEDLLSDAPCGFVSMNPSGNIIYANETIAEWIGAGVEELVGQLTVPDLLESASRLYYELQIEPMLRLQGRAKEISCRLAHRREPRSLPVLMSAQRRPATETCGERYDFVFFDASERENFERQLRASRADSEELAAIIRTAAVGVMRVRSDGVLKRWNRAAKKILDCTDHELSEVPIDELLHLDGLEHWFKKAVAALGSDGPEEHRFDASVNERRFLNISVTPVVIPEEPFEPPDYSVILRDVTKRVRAEHDLQLVVGELNHRVKNTLAVVQGMVNQSLRGVGVDGVRQSLLERLRSLSHSNHILTQAGWNAVRFGELFQPILDQGYAPERLVRDGPDIRLVPNQFRAFSMAFHELATNAIKYGALSSDEGRLHVHWAVEQGDTEMLRLEWREEGGPEVRPPSANGFGTRLIQSLFRSDFEGEVAFDYPPEGFRFKCRGLYIRP